MGTLAESLKFNFQTMYASADKPDDSHNLNFEFILNDYKVKIKY